MAKALAGSRVKVAGRDVAATQTIFVGFKILPLLYSFYTLVALAFMLAFWDIEGEDGQWYAWLADNAIWFLPLAVWLLLPWYSYFSVVMMEKIWRRLTMLPFLWIQLQVSFTYHVLCLYSEINLFRSIYLEIYTKFLQ